MTANKLILNLAKSNAIVVEPNSSNRKQKLTLLVRGVAATWRFWLCSRAGRLQGGGEMRLRGAHSKQK